MVHFFCVKILLESMVCMINFEKIKKEVSKFLENDDSGHAMDHVNRVLDLSLKFAETENANKDIVSLIALLHDVDDYKLFGEKSANNLINANIIMQNINISNDIQEKVCSSLKCIGYSKSLKGVRPVSLEGQIVSDADMCDALGVNGILRTYKYSLKNKKPFFDKNIYPIKDMDALKYNRKCSDSSVCHMFEKILKLKGLMMTQSGKEEAKKRHQIVVDVLYQFFDEENSDDWKIYLDNFLKEIYK